MDIAVTNTAADVNITAVLVPASGGEARGEDL